MNSFRFKKLSRGLSVLTMFTDVPAMEFSIMSPVYMAWENFGVLSFLSSTVTNTVAKACEETQDWIKQLQEHINCHQNKFINEMSFLSSTVTNTVAKACEETQDWIKQLQEHINCHQNKFINEICRLTSPFAWWVPLKIF